MADKSGTSITQAFEGLDMDSILERVEDGWYVDGWNFRVYAGAKGRGGAGRKLGGTLEIPWEKPATGENTGLGCYWDERGDTLIVFVHNTDGNHCLLWVHPDEPVARTILIPQMNLSLGNPVTGCALVNGELLLFTDGATYPKMLNLPRADSFEKKSIVRLYLPKSPIVLDSRSMTVGLTLGGVLQGIFYPLSQASQQEVWDYKPMFRHFAEQFNLNANLFDKFTAHGCAEYIEFEANQVGLWSIEATIIDTLNGQTTQSDVITEYWNRYNDPFTDEQIGLSRIAPQTAPTAVMATDTAKSSNDLNGIDFQFLYAYHLKDKERTLTSPISDIALPSTSECQNSGANYNCIDITFGDKWLLDPAMRGEIDSIDLLMRKGNNGSFFKVRNLLKHEWIYSRSYRFYNNGAYEPVDQAYALQGNTNVPPVANALELFTDAFDNTRVVLGGITEGDETPCLEVNLKVALDGVASDDSGDVTILANIIIQALFDPQPASSGQPYNKNQPIVVFDNAIGPVFGGMGPSPTGIGGFTPDPETWGQKIPLGGFPVYCAGTDLLGISQQTNFPAVYPNGQVTATIWSSSDPDHPANGRNVYDGTISGYHLNPLNDTHRQAIRDVIEWQTVYSTVRIGGLKRGQTYVIRVASNLCDILDDDSLYDINGPSRLYQKTSTRCSQVGSIQQTLTINQAGIKPGMYECTVEVPMQGPAFINIGNIVIWDTTNPNVISGSFVIDGYAFDDLGQDYSTDHDIRTLGVPAERQKVRFLNHDNISGLDVAFPASTYSFLLLAPALWPALAVIKFDLFLTSLFGNTGTAQGDYHTFTDHNGYWFFFNRNQPSHFPRAAWYGVTGDPGNPSGSVSGSGSNFYTVCNDFLGASGNKWEGGLEGALTVQVTGNLFNGPGWQQYIVPNHFSATYLRTHIRTVVTTVDGTPVAGVGALLEGGKFVTSGPNGVIDLIAYGDVEVNMNNRGFNTNGTDRDRLILISTGACTVTFLGGSLLPVHITQFQPGLPFSNTPDSSPWPNWYNIPTRLVMITGAGNGRYFGRGSRQLIGGYFGRYDGSRTPVQLLGDMDIPKLGQNLHLFEPLQWPLPPLQSGVWSSGRATIDWEIVGDVPDAWIGEWEFWQFVSTDDLTRAWYIQWVAGEVVYSTLWDGPSTPNAPTPTGWSNGNATEVYVEINDSLARYAKLYGNSLVNQLTPNAGYLWEDGDLLRVLTDKNRVPLHEIVEVPITGQRGKWITFRFNSSIRQLFGGEIIEILRPAKPTETSVVAFYDLPYARIQIDNSGPTPVFTQTSGTLGWGGTWLLPTQIPFLRNATTPWATVTYTRESRWRSDFFKSDDWGRGKPWFQDPDAATKLRGGLMRYSDSFKPGTNINGFNLFDGLNLRIVENMLGAIQVLRRTEDVIVGVCENGGFAIYVGVQQQQTTPAALLETVGGVLGNVRPFAFKFGTRHRLSVVRSATSLFWYDHNNGKMVYYNSNQLQDVAEQNKMHSYFVTKSATIPDGTVVCGFWDMANGDVGESFCPPPTVDGNGESVSYHDKANKFVAKMEYFPNCWGWTRQRLWSFKDGRLLLHDAPNAVPNRIDGVDLVSRISVAFVGREMELKEPKFIWLARGVKDEWVVTAVTTSDGNQFSRIPGSQWETLRGGVSKAAFLMDSNTPPTALTMPTLSDGAPLTATALIVEITHVGVDTNGVPTDFRLVNATLFYNDVTPTN